MIGDQREKEICAAGSQVYELDKASNGSTKEFHRFLIGRIQKGASALGLQEKMIKDRRERRRSVSLVASRAPCGAFIRLPDSPASFRLGGGAAFLRDRSLSPSCF